MMSDDESMFGRLDDMPTSLMIEGLSDALIREADAIHQLVVQSQVYVRRGDGERRGISEEIPRRRWHRPGRQLAHGRT